MCWLSRSNKKKNRIRNCACSINDSKRRIVLAQEEEEESYWKNLTRKCTGSIKFHKEEREESGRTLAQLDICPVSVELEEECSIKVKKVDDDNEIERMSSLSKSSELKKKEKKEKKD